ncbi:chromate resistance protein [Paenibacillus alginolyticus]|uniref:chromate resistance protein ChrB domain-containing protein n=1 Tax=Paenibacillus alginolyticus TaxID=59839 RepID=UPI000424EDC1|nr:chromate resistance protein ChrB domain-containing protein [Paenibacillus alginolyticus]MCY9667416.1 chromate resistance protein [Paenibacillus alginolyticus]
MKWVTWENVGVDRMACSWLIRRFIDPAAEFVFIPAGSAELPEDAEGFDIPGVKYTHYRGHCSFYTMVQSFKFNDPILQRIARIVDEADTLQEISVEPIAVGLDSICQGLRLISNNDLEAFDKGHQVYEALYAQLIQEKP